jgi:hypothetical protein
MVQEILDFKLEIPKSKMVAAAPLFLPFGHGLIATTKTILTCIPFKASVMNFGFFVSNAICKD